MPLHDRHKEQRGKNYLLLGILLSILVILYIISASKFTP
jgi:hypothetical protein